VYLKNKISHILFWWMHCAGLLQLEYCY